MFGLKSFYRRQIVSSEFASPHNDSVQLRPRGSGMRDTCGRLSTRSASHCSSFQHGTWWPDGPSLSCFVSSVFSFKPTWVKKVPEGNFIEAKFVPALMMSEADKLNETNVVWIPRKSPSLIISGFFHLSKRSSNLYWQTSYGSVAFPRWKISGWLQFTQPIKVFSCYVHKQEG